MAVLFFSLPPKQYAVHTRKQFNTTAIKSDILQDLNITFMFLYKYINLSSNFVKHILWIIYEGNFLPLVDKET